MSKITELRERLATLAAKATPGWEVWNKDEQVIAGRTRYVARITLRGHELDEEDCANRDLSIQLRNAVPLLVKVMEAYELERDMNDALDKLCVAYRTGKVPHAALDKIALIRDLHAESRKEVDRLAAKEIA